MDGPKCFWDLWGELIVKPAVKTFNQIKVYDKQWGKEIVYAQNDLYSGKLLFIENDKISSYHYHKIKDETFYVIKGVCE